MNGERKTWRTWDEIVDLFHGPADTEWASDQALIDQNIKDPWERQGRSA